MLYNSSAQFPGKPNYSSNDNKCMKATVTSENRSCLWDWCLAYWAVVSIHQLCILKQFYLLLFILCHGPSHCNHPGTKSPYNISHLKTYLLSIFSFLSNAQNASMYALSQDHYCMTFSYFSRSKVVSLTRGTDYQCRIILTIKCSMSPQNSYVEAFNSKAMVSGDGATRG